MVKGFLDSEDEDGECPRRVYARALAPPSCAGLHLPPATRSSAWDSVVLDRL